MARSKDLAWRSRDRSPNGPALHDRGFIRWMEDWQSVFALRVAPIDSQDLSSLASSREIALVAWSPKSAVRIEVSFSEKKTARLEDPLDLQSIRATRTTRCDDNSADEREL